MTIVVGTAGHVDHGKSALLRALTGIDPDRLPDEQRRGMTIDVGYAHLGTGDGGAIDFVDVPGHDRFVGNMLVGAGEIDAAMLVVAADDGPRPQTLEHLEILDALGISDGIAVITKSDLLAPDDPRWIALRSAIAALLAPTTLSGAPIVVVSSATGEGIDVLRVQLEALTTRLRRRTVAEGPVRMWIDRSFTIRGRGRVVTGTLRGGPIASGRILRLEPDGLPVRVREIQVHSRKVDRVSGGGRVALNMVGAGSTPVRRGAVVTDDPVVVVASRLLVSLRLPAVSDGAAPVRALKDGASVVLHIGTDHIPATVALVGRPALETKDGQRLGLLKLARPTAVTLGDRCVLRRPSPPSNAAACRILDPAPPRSLSLRGDRREAVLALAEAGDAAGMIGAMVRLHGALPAARAAAHGIELPPGTIRIGDHLVPEDAAAIILEALDRLIGSLDPGQSPGRAAVTLRPRLREVVERTLSLARPDSAPVVEALLRDWASPALLRQIDAATRSDGSPGWAPGIVATMGRVEALLASYTPPPLSEVAGAAGCPPDAMRELEASGRIVRVDETLAYSRGTYAALERIALSLAGAGPITPAAYRDATGTSRRYAVALLEDMNRRAVLKRTPVGHIRGPRAPRDATSSAG
ncbi:MAG: selenocysteine-specific translation elongation factor [Myxococcales bacterium]|nr:selenocysteine-specific translation elongation factor [Myxococcales bacterium]